MVDAQTQTEPLAVDPDLLSTPWGLPCEAHAVACCGLCYEMAQEAAERSTAVVIHNLLSPTQMDTIVGDAQEILPHLCELAEQCGGPCAGLLALELEGSPHHTAFTEEHILLNLHHDSFFQDNYETIHETILSGMASYPSEWGVGTSALSVRCIELHTYAPGGGLVAPGHRDHGSVLSMSVLLTDPADVDGGDFITYAEGSPIVHKLRRGDAILFLSEKIHNVSTVVRGIRRSLVVEQWSGVANQKDRFK